MLSEISQSSKRMGKLKKYKNKVKESGFDFLLQSLDRDKENHAPNHLTAHRPALAQSIQIDPLLTAPVHSFTLRQCPPSDKQPFYLENVKLLDRSDITLSENNHSQPSRKSKRREGSSKSRNGRREGRRNGSGSRQSQGEQLDQLIYKMKQYLSITDDILGDIDTSRWKFGKKAKSISKELVSLITAIENSSTDPAKGLSQTSLMNHSVKTTSFNMYGSQILAQQSTSLEPSPFVKRITENQREKLHSLISQHQMANIKMFIKLNEGESEEIQHCKKQLASLFDKYKILEGLVGKEKKKMAQMAKEKKEAESKCEEMGQQNKELMGMIEKLQETLERQQKINKERERERERESLAPIRVSMLRPQSHLRQHSYPSLLQNSHFSRGDLRIQSLQNSCNESHLSNEDIMPLSSSITTSTSRQKKKGGGRLGINLNALLQNLTRDQVQRIADDPQRLKTMMRECRQTILRMEGIITEQNQQLQLSISTLQDLQMRIKEKDEQIAVIEEKLAQEQARKRKQIKTTLHDSESKGKRGKKQDRKVQIDQKGKLSIDLTFKKTKYDEYRIIAMQALALEQALANQRIR